jgi:hypothetical protein
MTPDRRANSDHEPEPIPLEDVLDAYLASVDEPSSGALAEWIRRFPDYSQELTEFAAAWALMEALPLDPGNVERSTQDRAAGKASGARSAAEVCPGHRGVGGRGKGARPVTSETRGRGGHERGARAQA